MGKIRTILLLATILGAFSCTADYDTFGASDYRSLNGIALLEQDGSPMLYADDHKLVFTLTPPPDSLGTWDSVTVADIDISNMASLHLVESKFKDFPSDSSALDSLSREVVYEKGKIRKKRRLRIPKSQILYVVVVSESGEPSIWQWSFRIPGVEPPMSSGGASGETSSSSSAPVSCSSSETLSGKNALTFVFENQIRMDTIADTLWARLSPSADPNSLVLKSWTASDHADVSPNPDSVKTWSDSQTFTVTAENGTVKIWTLRFSFSEQTDVLHLSAKGQKKSFIDVAEKTVTVYFESEASLASVVIDSLLLSDGATSDLARSGLDLTREKSFTVSHGDSSRVWKLLGKVAANPKILSLQIQGMDAEVDSASGVVHLDTLPFLSDLTNLELSDVKYSEGSSSADLQIGSAFDFGAGVRVLVKNVLGEEASYEIRAGYQYPNSGFNQWKEDDFGNKNDVEGWDNGNNDAISKTKTLTVGGGGGTVVKMESVDAKVLGIGRFASGNMLVAYFNPKKVASLQMTKYDDGNELIDFGRPFNARPRYVEFDVKYEGKNDSCDLYVLLENRSRTSDEGKNQFRKSEDVNTLVASAWYRATTDSSLQNPDVVSVVAASRAGYKTIRLKFQYGEPLDGSPIENSSVFATSLKNSAGIDNHLVSTSSPENFPVTHIRIVMASSAMGNLYKGTVGATLWCDEVRLIY